LGRATYAVHFNAAEEAEAIGILKDRACFSRAKQGTARSKFFHVTRGALWSPTPRADRHFCPDGQNFAQCLLPTARFLHKCKCVCKSGIRFQYVLKSSGVLKGALPLLRCLSDYGCERFRKRWHQGL
jgi:hypothetical protein